MDLMFIKPDINAQMPLNTVIITKFIIQLGVNDFEKILNTTIPTININKERISLLLNFNLNIFIAKNN